MSLNYMNDFGYPMTPHGYRAPRPESVTIGPEMLEVLDQWRRREFGPPGIWYLSYLAHLLQGRGQEIIRLLESDGSERAKKILESLYWHASGSYHRNWCAVVHNAPLKMIKLELLGEE